MSLNSKLYFYNIVKSENSFEPYPKINEYEKREALAQLRSSNHRQKCETWSGEVLSHRKPELKLKIGN